MKISSKKQLTNAVYVALEQIADDIEGSEDFSASDFFEAVQMASHDASVCLSELMPKAVPA